LAAIAFVMEVFGASYGPPAIIACVLTYKMARRWRLYVEPNDDGEK
jgi:CIC family chloride channel protein